MIIKMLVILVLSLLIGCEKEIEVVESSHVTVFNTSNYTDENDTLIIFNEDNYDAMFVFDDNILPHLEMKASFFNISRYAFIKGEAKKGFKVILIECFNSKLKINDTMLYCES